ncbi:unnamed protein product [Nyctereutes procyonoides]|uniref:(raccoon dog) hypothetical protein n=1 Tax=Nyctereutes procyonoides TaxID=34880 RepID=A0A811Y779_NYCPR|nr:unnamed protein product [Nyctereutes procyonoides]
MVFIFSPIDVMCHVSQMLKEGEAMETAKGLESILVTGPGGMFCLGNKRWPKGKNMQRGRAKGDRCYNCGLPPQPKKCHFCQGISLMVASCPLKGQQVPSSQESQPTFRRKKKKRSIALPCSQRHN